MKNFNKIAVALTLGLAIGYQAYPELNSLAGELIGALLLSFWGMIIGMVVFDFWLDGKRFFTATTNNGLIIALAGFALMLLGPFVATRLFGGQLTSHTWFGTIFIYGMVTGAIMRYGAIDPPDFRSLSRDDQEKFHRKQAGLEPRG